MLQRRVIVLRWEYQSILVRRKAFWLSLGGGGVGIKKIVNQVLKDEQELSREDEAI